MSERPEQLAEWSRQDHIDHARELLQPAEGYWALFDPDTQPQVSVLEALGHLLLAQLQNGSPTNPEHDLTEPTSRGALNE